MNASTPVPTGAAPASPGVDVVRLVRRIGLAAGPAFALLLSACATLSQPQLDAAAAVAHAARSTRVDCARADACRGSWAGARTAGPW